MENKKYCLYIGRYQGTHMGHQAIFNESLKQGKNILIAIRDVPTDEKNPFTPEEVKLLWEKVYSSRVKDGSVKVIIIPDIESVNYGRGVGYEVNEIKVPDNIATISATEIRNNIINDVDDWKLFVDESIHEDIYRLLKEKQLC